MRQAREILREYRERRASEGAPASAALREENLRRLLRHVAAAHPAPEALEPRLLEAMRRASEERPQRREPAARWPWRSRPAWQLWAPAAALAAAALVAVGPRYRSGRAVRLGQLPPARMPGGHRTPPPTARVSEPEPLIGYVLVGELLRRHAGDPQWQPLESGAAIRLDDTVRTEANTAGRVVFLDDSVCSVMPDSTLTYTAAARTGLKRPGVLLLARGETWNTVESGGPPFVVATRSATAVVRGTEFGVAVDAAGKTTLRVTRGKVTMQAAHGMVLVAAGMESIALPGHAPRAPVLMAAAAQPPASGKSQPGAPRIATARPRGASHTGSGNGETSLRTTVPALKPAAPAGEPPPGPPADSSSPSTSSSSEHGTDAPPVSTSP